MRASEFISGHVMAKIEKTGQIVQILRHEDEVGFSDDPGWFLVNTEPGRRIGTGIKWIPDSTRFAWVKKFDSLKESKTATAQQVLSYINKTHHVPFRPGEKMYKAVAAHPHWELQRVPLLNLNIPDQEYDDVDYDEYEPELDPYGRAMLVDPKHAGRVSQDIVDRQPIVIDADRYIIDGNHRAWAAKYLLNRDYIDAWVPVAQKQAVAEARMPRAIEDFLDGLTADDVGVEEIGPYRIHFEGFTDDCKSSKDYCRDPEAVYQQVYNDFIQREGGRRPIIQDMVGDEDYPILYSIFRKHKTKVAVKEVNYPDELSVSDQIQQYFFKRGYELAGEGRDQMAFESPRGTIVKVLGIGEDEREEVVKRYVRFFEQNQRNPFYPRIYNSGNFTVDGETYFVYEMERVNYVANEEATLDYIEKLMSAVDREQGEQFLQKNPVPAEMSEAEIFGLIQATEDMIQVLGGQAPLDLTAVENLGRRNNGHLVIVDPYSL